MQMDIWWVLGSVGIIPYFLFDKRSDAMNYGDPYRFQAGMKYATNFDARD